MPEEHCAFTRLHIGALGLEFDPHFVGGFFSIMGFFTPLGEWFFFGVEVLFTLGRQKFFARGRPFFRHIGYDFERHGTGRRAQQRCQYAQQGKIIKKGVQFRVHHFSPLKISKHAERRASSIRP